MPSKIDWCDESINPLGWGCYGPGGTAEHPLLCSYCYAKRLSKGGWGKARGCKLCQAFIPHLHPEQYEKPYLWKKPRRIFVQSMGDLFGAWVPEIHIDLMLHVAGKCPQHTFLFLTKNPRRYLDFTFPDNCQLGTTITGKYTANNWPNDIEDLDRAEALRKVPNKTFLSIEPIQGAFHGHLFDGIDQIIIGADSTRGAMVPPLEWVKSIDHPNIFYKENIKKHYGGRL